MSTSRRGDTELCGLPRVAHSDLPQDILEPLPIRRKLSLVLEILRSYAEATRMMRRHRFPEAVQSLRTCSSLTEPEPTDASPRETITFLQSARLANAVTRTLRALPTDARCLKQSLVLTHLLSARGIPSRLVIGVKPGEGFGAHAWVEYRGVALLPSEQPAYQRLTEI